MILKTKIDRSTFVIERRCWSKRKFESFSHLIITLNVIDENEFVRKLNENVSIDRDFYYFESVRQLQQFWSMKNKSFVIEFCQSNSDLKRIEKNLSSFRNVFFVFPTENICLENRLSPNLSNKEKIKKKSIRKWIFIQKSLRTFGQILLTFSRSSLTFVDHEFKQNRSVWQRFVNNSKRKVKWNSHR